MKGADKWKEASENRNINRRRIKKKEIKGENEGRINNRKGLINKKKQNKLRMK